MDITLALSGGGMRGAAHVGVLRVLDREGFRVHALAGTSIGAIVGVLYAFGYTPNEIEHIARDIDQSKLYGWPFSDGAGLLGVRGVAHLLKVHLGESTFDDLKVPCAVAAVDLNSNREIILNEGRLVDALLASMAIPGLFPFRVLDKYRLVDGGILDPVPVQAARALAPAFPVVAVSLMSPLQQPVTPPSLQTSTHNTLIDQLARLSPTQAFRTFVSAVDIGQRQMAEMRLKADAPEVLIHPDVDHIGLTDRINVGDVVRRGERAAENALPDLYRAVAWPARIGRSLRLHSH
jgi:NTE family protein